MMKKRLQKMLFLIDLFSAGLKGGCDQKNVEIIIQLLREFYGEMMNVKNYMILLKGGGDELLL
jgi:hypothetical protein